MSDVINFVDHLYWRSMSDASLLNFEWFFRFEISFRLIEEHMGADRQTVDRVIAESYNAPAYVAVRREIKRRADKGNTTMRSIYFQHYQRVC